jgi:hypothetical protein
MFMVFCRVIYNTYNVLRAKEACGFTPEYFCDEQFFHLPQNFLRGKIPLIYFLSGLK